MPRKFDKIGAPTGSKYVTLSADSELSHEFSLGTLTSGILKHSVSAGVSTLSTATGGVDYLSFGTNYGSFYLTSDTISRFISVGYGDASYLVGLSGGNGSAKNPFIYFDSNQTLLIGGSNWNGISSPTPNTLVTAIGISDSKIVIGSAIDYNNKVTIPYDISLTNNSDKVLGVIPSTTDQTGHSLTILAGGSVSTGNYNGGNLILSAGNSNGSGNSSVFVKAANGSGSTPNTPINVGSFNTKQGITILRGSLCGYRLELPHTIKKVASANIRNSHDDEITSTSATYVKVKTITLTYGLTGQARFLFDIKTSDSGTPETAYARIYVSGVELGTERTDITGSYATKSEDIVYDFTPGSTVELWIKIGNGDTVSVRNFRMAYDDSPTIEVYSLNT